MTNTSDSRFIIGDIGEKAVERLLNTQRTDDWYDTEKDGICGDMTYEVKTFRINNKTNGFWLGENYSKTMWKKVDKVDMLYFIKIPESKNELASIYLCINHKNCWVKAYRNNGEAVRSYPISKCIHLFDLSKQESFTLLKHSEKISTYRRVPNNVF